MHCFGNLYGLLIAPNTGFSCAQSFSNTDPGFRIAATGLVLNVEQSVEIVKELKLTGHPYDIFKIMAFIKDVFSTSLEIAKFEGASIKTVSGIRGQIKRAFSKPEGCYRTTFEDKAFIVVTDLLGAEEGEGDGWQILRLTGQIRAENNILTSEDKNSNYRPIERQTRHFNNLRVPQRLAADLPFKSQIAQQKRAVVVRKEEHAVRDLMQKLMTLRNEKVEKRRLKHEERRPPYRAKVEENEEKRSERKKREMSEHWRREGKTRYN
ncbi:Glycoside hydrolase 2 (Mannanase, beta-galactosidase) [Elasticomyces elasticus]|nr:Glycoside hydrolase 2 (Mannanase, beta-galactosidase) [Elasticomyces elasticus]